MGGVVKRTTFQLILIKPTHYDDDGYPITWLRSHIPSNTLAALYGLGDDCRRRQVLGPDVDIVIKPNTDLAIANGKIARIDASIPANQARVLVLIPAGKKMKVENGALKAGGVTVDYRYEG